jgi:hypothetical protein
VGMARNLPALVGRRNFRPRGALYYRREHQTCFRPGSPGSSAPTSPAAPGLFLSNRAVQKRGAASRPMPELYGAARARNMPLLDSAPGAKRASKVL